MHRVTYPFLKKYPCVCVRMCQHPQFLSLTSPPSSSFSLVEGMLSFINVLGAQWQPPALTFSLTLPDQLPISSLASIFLNEPRLEPARSEGFQFLAGYCGIYGAKRVGPPMRLFLTDTKTNGQFSHLIRENITPTSFLESVIQDDHFF